MHKSLEFNSHMCTDPSQKTQLGGKKKSQQSLHLHFLQDSGHSWLKWHPHDEISTQVSKWECRQQKKPLIWPVWTQNFLKKSSEGCSKPCAEPLAPYPASGCALGGFLWSSDPFLNKVSRIRTDPSKPELSEMALATLKQLLDFSDTIYFAPVTSRSIHWLSLNFVINRIF